MDEAKIEAAILSALARRGPGRTICPSEAARALSADWRPLMGPVRAVAARLAREGRLVATRGGAVVEADAPGGPIRLGAP